ncbi:MAG: hypothetical protein JSW58_06465 [Candidatus Latescibacterota bacterium]|nr:MAG: hypothetical protein JSW58_06465 [Candidatus Latescibacterota bacterium]
MKWSILIGVVILAVLSATLFISCSEDDKSPTAPYQKESICPLSKGNIWTFVDSTFFDHQVYVDTLRLEISGDTIVTFENMDYRVYFWSWEIWGAPSNCTRLVREEDDGLWDLGIVSSSDTLITRSLWAKNPVSQGECWQRDNVLCDCAGSISLLGSVDIECVATNESFETQAGVFSCNVYRTHFGQTTDVYEYFAPDIGLVGYVVIVDDEMSSKSTLCSYHING